MKRTIIVMLLIPLMIPLLFVNSISHNINNTLTMGGSEGPNLSMAYYAFSENYSSYHNSQDENNISYIMEVNERKKSEYEKYVLIISMLALLISIISLIISLYLYRNKYTRT